MQNQMSYVAVEDTNSESDVSVKQKCKTFEVLSMTKQANWISPVVVCSAAGGLEVTFPVCSLMLQKFSSVFKKWNQT